MRKAPRLLIVAALLAALHALVLAGRVPLLTSIDGWFWHFSRKPIEAMELAPVLAALAAAVLWWTLRPGRAAPRVAALIGLGFALQLGFGFLEGRGIDGVRDRIVRTGHSEFAKVAAYYPDAIDLVRRYEELAAADKLGSYAKSKPPGTLLLYVATERFGGIGAGKRPYPERLEALRTFAAWLWPLLSYLVLVPMFLFARRAWDERTALVACALYTVVPSVALITLHTDQTFFPLLVMTTVWLCARAAAEKSVPLGAAAGAVFYATVFCSFGLLAIVPIAAAAALAARPAWRELGRPVLAALGGFAAANFVARLVFDYDILVRYRNAVDYHVAWRGWEWTPGTVLHFAGLNSVEFAVWLGVPVAVFAVAGALRGTAALAKRSFSSESLLAASLTLVFLVLAFFGQTKAESARLWLFLVPLACLIAARALTKSGPAATVPVVLGLQFVTVLLTKVFQDFR